MRKHPPRRSVGTIPWLGYWFDIYAPDGQPANSKVLSTIGFWFGWLIMFAWVVRVDTLGMEFVYSLALIVGIPFGFDGIKSWNKRKEIQP